MSDNQPSNAQSAPDEPRVTQQGKPKNKHKQAKLASALRQNLLRRKQAKKPDSDTLKQGK